ncbi:MAG: PD-(D/E)XK nuclease family protein, partial [Nonlabens sp.]|nr:PD-(D/E)XK nuclease family protein [Nonlabens sp.]
MMKTFIDQILDNLEQKNLESTKCTFVVPSRRVRLFLNSAIAKRLDKPSFSPVIYSIEDFVAHLSGMRILPDLEILPLFYQAYLKVEKQNHDSYDEFLGWAITILADFNEIDRYLVEPESFFSYLGNVKELDSNHWSLEHNPTQIVSKYLRFWKKLHLYYNAL